MKKTISVILSVIGGLIVEFLGGVDSLLIALVAFMVVDYITGLAVALIFHKSKKTDGGGASSKEGFKGIVKKVCILLLVGLAHEVDVLMGADYIRAITVTFFIANEGLSVLENLGLMDIKYPTFLTRALEILRDKAEGEGNDDTKRD